MPGEVEKTMIKICYLEKKNQQHYFQFKKKGGGVLVTKPDDRTSIPGTHMIQKENQFLQIVFCHLWYAHAPNLINVVIKKS